MAPIRLMDSSFSFALNSPEIKYRSKIKLTGNKYKIVYNSMLSSGFRWCKGYNIPNANPPFTLLPAPPYTGRGVFFTGLSSFLILKEVIFIYFARYNIRNIFQGNLDISPIICENNHGI